MNSGKLKLRQLEAFIEVYQWRKISAAAERLFLTQSAVSILIRQLEAAVDASLFDRTTRSLVPTAAADDLLPVALRITRDVRSAENMFRFSHSPVGRVSVAATPTLAMTLLPGLIREFKDAYPGIHVDVNDCSTEEFVPEILSGRSDLGIGFPGQELKELTQTRLIEDHLCLACLADDRLAKVRKLSWGAISSVPLILIKPGYGIRSAIERAANKTGVTLQVSGEAALLTTALALTAAGLGNTIAPAELIGLSGFKGLVARKIVAPEVKRNIVAVTDKNRTPSEAARKFLESVQSTLARSGH